MKDFREKLKSLFERRNDKKEKVQPWLFVPWTSVLVLLLIVIFTWLYNENTPTCMAYLFCLVSIVFLSTVIFIVYKLDTYE